MAVLKYKCAECGAEILTTSYDNLEHKHGNLVFCCAEHFNTYFHRQSAERIKARMAERERIAKAHYEEWENQRQKEADEFKAKLAKIAKEKYERSHKDTISVDGVLYSSDRLWLVEVPKDTESFEVPEGVTEICYKAFADCENLTSVKLPDTVKIIDQEAFLNCKKLTSITIPASVKKVGDGAFERCESLKNLVISEGVSELGGYCFYCCSSLESVSIPESIKKIGYGKDPDPGFGTSGIKGLFGHCTSLSKVILPEGMEEIPAGMFENCKLKTISIPETVTKIGDSAFYSSSLESITIPASVTEIEDYAFHSCNKLQSVKYLGEEPTLGKAVFTMSGIEVAQEKRESKNTKIKTLILCPFKNLILVGDNLITWLIGVVLWFFTITIPLEDVNIVLRIVFAVLASDIAKTIPDMIIYKGDYNCVKHQTLWKIVYTVLRFIIPLAIIILYKFFDYNVFDFFNA